MPSPVSRSSVHSVAIYPAGSGIASTPLELGQPWAAQPNVRLRKSSVTTTWNPHELLVQADLEDDEIFTTATGDNQPLWDLGDVFEMFLKPEGRDAYAELHVNPLNHRMHLRLPNPERKPAPNAVALEFEEMLVSPVGFTSRVARTAAGWSVHAVVPAEVIGASCFAAGQVLRASFCRYDASGGEPPVLSTTSAHPVIAFHRPHEWTRLMLAERAVE